MVNTKDYSIRSVPEGADFPCSRYFLSIHISQNILDRVVNFIQPGFERRQLVESVPIIAEHR
jgi:hypothetical protein